MVASAANELQRGLVPTIKYSNGILNDEIITESAIVTQFLADSRPSHLLPASLSSPTAPLVRARINFFVDTWSTKIGGYFRTILAADSKEDKEAKSKEMVEAVKKEIEPLLKDANPFFGGSEELTFAEVRLAPRDCNENDAEFNRFKSRHSCSASTPWLMANTFRYRSRKVSTNCQTSRSGRQQR